MAMRPDFRDIDPRELRLPSSRLAGADPAKLQRQIAQFGDRSAVCLRCWFMKQRITFWCCMME